ncbi:MAG: M48 family metallopeptidase [Deltaproteobacteria bacterium]|nr:M48 family metallopeptidase [Deltaproteobacteria bacterium]
MRYAKRFVFTLALFFLVLALACARAPITGRSQLMLVPQSQLLAMSDDQFETFLSEHEVVKGTDNARMVEEVGRDIARAVEEYFRQNGMFDELDSYKWEFALVAEDQINAFAMPGGKVVVYEGIMPVAKTEAGLATVMAHEVAHVVARHGAERMSHFLLTQLGGLALSVALSEQPQQTQALWMTAYGVGAQVGYLLPYSRLQEKEADKLGLVFMAMAGYDPHAAVDLWQRMAAQKEDGGPPVFLSTHPTDQQRIEYIYDYIPEAMKYYHPKE